MKILIISAWFPYPSDNGSRLRIFNLIKNLSDHHQVTLIAFRRRPLNPGDLEALRPYCQDIKIVPWREFNPRGLKATLAYLHPQPRALVDTYSAQMAALIREQVSANGFDAAVISEISMAAYRRCLGSLPVLWEDLELAVIHDAVQSGSSRLSRARVNLTWLKTSRFVASTLDSVQTCTVVSRREADLVHQIAPGYDSLEIIPNCIDYAAYASVTANPEPYSLIYTGALAYQANYQAVAYFLEQVFPPLKTEIPQVAFQVTGSVEGIQLPPGADQDGVRFTGHIEDIKTAIARSWVSVVPLLQGGGTRLKILEAFALGTPVVSTSKGAEGLDVVSGKHLLIADSPQTFLDALLHLLHDAHLRQALAGNARELVRKHYNWTEVIPRFLDLVERLPARYT